MPPDMQSPRQLATTPPDLIVRPGFRPPSGGPPGTYRPDPAGGAAPYRPGSGGGGRLHQGDGRDPGHADPQGPALGRRGAVNLQNYPRMLSRNINGTGEHLREKLTCFCVVTSILTTLYMPDKFYLYLSIKKTQITKANTRAQYSSFFFLCNDSAHVHWLDSLSCIASKWEMAYCRKYHNSQTH